MARRVFITVAEVSGDKHAAQLVYSLKQLDPELIVEGHGGPEMAAAGAIIHRDTVTKAAMGWRGILRATEIYPILRWTRRYFEQNRPDIQIGVDSPSMNFHFAKAARRLGIPSLQYVAPQLWAWAPWRMGKLRKWVDRVACILPFEEPYFRAHGVNATFVGHPLFDQLPSHRHERNGTPLEGRAPVVGLLPGSRKSEAERNFPQMLRIAQRLQAEFPGIQFLIPTTAATHPVVEEMLREKGSGFSVQGSGAEEAGARSQKPEESAVGSALADAEPSEAQGSASQARPLSLPIQQSAFSIQHSSSQSSVLSPQSFSFALDAFDSMVPRCDLCITVSGTATLHVAGFGVPMIVVYRINPFTWNAAGRWIVRTRTFALVNLLGKQTTATNAAAAGGHIVPEFVPWHGPADEVADLAIDMLRHPAKLDEQRERLNRLVQSLDHPGASMNVARLAMQMMNGKQDGE